MKRKSNKNRR